MGHTEKFLEGHCNVWIYQRGVKSKDKGEIAKELANFISELHRIPITIADQFHIRTADRRRAYEKLFRDATRHLFPRFSMPEKKAAEDYFEKLEQTLAHRYQKVLAHHDLIGPHIYIRHDLTRLAGIIDFSDRSIDDPAIDFYGLWHYGPKFVKTVFKYYRGVKDAHFLERALLYSQRRPFWDTIDPFNYGKGSFERGYRAFRKIFLRAH